MNSILNNIYIYIYIYIYVYIYISTHELNVHCRGNLSIIYITYTVYRCHTIMVLSASQLGHMLTAFISVGETLFCMTFYVNWPMPARKAQM